MNPDQDRRCAPRLATVHNQTRLEWWEGQSGRESTASLVNLSTSGALIRTETPPREQTLIWLRLEQPARSSWIGARVVRRDGPELAGVAFVEPCPFDFLQAATLGIDLGNLV